MNHYEEILRSSASQLIVSQNIRLFSAMGWKSWDEVVTLTEVSRVYVETPPQD